MKAVDVALAATVGLGAVAVARQRHERRLVQTGRRAPTLATTNALPASVGRLEGVATWLPEPPRTRLGRLSAAAWAAPLTTVGAGLVWLGRTGARWDPSLGAYLALGVGGMPGRLLRALGMDANAVGQIIVCRHARPSKGLLQHEAMHVRQAERLGPMIVPLYVWFGARFGYRDNPLERAARRHARITTVRTTRP